MLLGLCTIWLWDNSAPFFKGKKLVFISAFTGVMCFVLPIIFNPPDFFAYKNYSNTSVGYKAPLDLMYGPDQLHPPAVDLTKGKHILLFLSMTCPHCKIAARKFSIIYKQNPALPIQMILNGDTTEINSFYKETKSENLPYNYFLGGKKFFKLVGPQVPMVFWMNDGIVEKKTIFQLTEKSEIEKWLDH
jgi:hypothetical protein